GAEGARNSFGAFSSEVVRAWLAKCVTRTKKQNCSLPQSDFYCAVHRATVVAPWVFVAGPGSHSAFEKERGALHRHVPRFRRIPGQPPGGPAPAQSADLHDAKSAATYRPGDS